ncbi:hypothetical protein M885DRAFT_584172 [Pelagophyceae sp. CCMP2097]|nr:hypothetical protein M885DRAFT_584172 [Pelagophyceae sp. CCMP2097]|mmetsp:Transcript_31356/g.105611  ORF Transcript_31356/g.105611 Transcript_31356/m.105611 type:complete len:236 (+) Transcript_31356:37-744(+)
MGRVAKYRKIKACDPFAKKRPAIVEKREMNLAPIEADDFGNDDVTALRADLDAEAPSKISRARERREERDALRDDLYVAGLESKRRPQKVVIEPRKTDESAKAFARRVKDTGQKILIDAAKSNSSSKQRGKEYLKTKKAKSKEKPAPKVDEDAEDGWAKAEPARFLDRADAPPDLRVRPKGKRGRDDVDDADAKKPSNPQKADPVKTATEKQKLKAARAKYTAGAAQMGDWETAF